MLSAALRGSSQAASELLPLVYDELRHLASSQLAAEPSGQTLQPTALVHEAWLRLSSKNERTWENRAHFLHAAALAMRRILVDASRAKKCQKRFHGTQRIDIFETDLAEAVPDDRILRVNDALDRLAEMDPDSAQLVILKFFGGFTNQEIASLHNVGERTIERQWSYAKSALYALLEREPTDIPAPPEDSSI